MVQSDNNFCHFHYRCVLHCTIKTATAPQENTMTYTDSIAQTQQTIADQPNWDGISAESVARMRAQNRFRTGLDIAKYTAGIMTAI